MHRHYITLYTDDAAPFAFLIIIVIIIFITIIIYNCCYTVENKLPNYTRPKLLFRLVISA